MVQAEMIECELTWGKKIQSCLCFLSGTSKVPLEGFKALQGIGGPQKFQIHKIYGASDRLPSAHTCFNQLDLPEYESKEQLAERLAMAIHEGHEGFGFG
jgi:E3 ubiquitin-protein ligase HUWE1